MTLLSVAAVDFAKHHVDSFWDSDFFPKAFEFLALWPRWSEVTAYLSSTFHPQFGGCSTSHDAGAEAWW
jgi:hypothetical protein